MINYFTNFLLIINSVFIGLRPRDPIVHLFDESIKCSDKLKPIAFGLFNFLSEKMAISYRVKLRLRLVAKSPSH